MLILPQEWLNKWKGKDIFAEIFSLSGMPFRNIDERKTLRYECNNLNYFVKTYSGYRIINVIKSLAKRRKPCIGSINESRALLTLQELGFTPCLVGFGWRRLNPFSHQSFSITAEIPNTIDLDALCADSDKFNISFDLKHALIRKIAQIIKNMHMRGICHYDLTLEHFLLDISSGIENLDHDNLKIYLIDFHISNSFTILPKKWLIADLVTLYFYALKKSLTQRDALRFVKYYREQPLRQILKTEKSMWKKIRKLAMR